MRLTTNPDAFNWQYGLIDEQGTKSHLFFSVASDSDSVDPRYIHYGSTFSATVNSEQDNVYLFVERQICKHEYSFQEEDWKWYTDWILGELVVSAYAEFTCNACNQTVKVEATVKEL